MTLDACAANDQVLQTQVPVKITQPDTKEQSHQMSIHRVIFVTGTYTGDVTRAELRVNDTFINTGGIFIDGSFEYYVGGYIHKGDHAN